MPLKLKNNAFILVIGIGIVLRFFFLAHKDFWCDEFLAISLSRIPDFLDMVRWIIKNDAHPPLFYSIIRIIFRFTQSEFGLRFIPCIFGVSALILFYRLLREANIKNYLLPLTLFALSSAAILWSQTVKSYSMLTFCSLLSSLMFLCYKKRDRTIYAVWWVISSIFMLYLHNYGIIVVLGEIAIILFYRDDISVKKWGIPLCVVFLFYLPYLLGPLFSQVAFAKTATHSIVHPILRISYTAFYFIFGETLSPLNYIFVIPGLLLFLIIFIQGGVTGKNILNSFSVILLIFGIIAVFVMKSTIPQNLIHLQPFFFILIGSGAAKIKSERVKNLVSALLILFLIPPLWYYYTGNSLQYHDVSKLIPFKEISNVIEREENKGEVIIINEQRERRFVAFFEAYSPWDWYYKGTLPIVEVSAENTEHLESELKNIYSKYNGFWPILKYNSAEQQSNEYLKNFFIQSKSDKIKEMRIINNYSFLDILKGKQEYYFLEVLHYIKLL
ncbi:MAG: hypothetical protein GX554_06050 [Elusimicrobia bacterium]|nr:hypothetical protein [Elusimicrobiota bacterium]